MPTVEIIKWISSIILILGTIATTMDLYPTNMYLQLAGVGGWLFVAIFLKDYPLMLVNAVGFVVLILGTLSYIIN